MKYKKEKSNSTFTEINFVGGATVIENAKEVIINNHCTITKSTKE
jgi:hypothetical protein